MHSPSPDVFLKVRAGHGAQAAAPGARQCPWSHAQAPALVLPSCSVHEYIGHRAQLALRSCSLKKPCRHGSHFSPSSPRIVWFSKPGRQRHSRTLLKFDPWRVSEPAGQRCLGAMGSANATLASALASAKHRQPATRAWVACILAPSARK